MTVSRRPSAFSILLLMLGVVLFCSLGVWQLRRATYKEGVLANFQAAARAPLVTLGAAATTADGYPHLRVQGTFESGKVYLLENQIRDGRLGVMVFAPLHVADQRRTLLVNLGFLANVGPDALHPPDVPPIPMQTVTLTGIYAPPPPPGLKLGGNPLPHQNAWPKVVTWMDLDDVARDLGKTLYPHVLLLDPQPDSAYLRVWSANVTIPPARHLAYAFQWFTFAAASVALFFVMQHVKHKRMNALKRSNSA